MRGFGGELLAVSQSRANLVEQVINDKFQSLNKATQRQTLCELEKEKFKSA